MNYPISTEVRVCNDALSKELIAAFKRIWETIIELPLEQIDKTDIDLNSFPWVGAVAWIGGSWTGNVRIGIAPDLASQISCKLLGIENPEEEEVNDTLRELANMTAGNLKSVLPGKNGLATPGNFKVYGLQDSEDCFSSLVTCWFKSGKHQLFVALSSL